MRSLFLFAISTLLLISCKQKIDPSQITVDSGFSTYVNAFSSGVVSSQSNIRVVLTEPNEQAKIDQPLTVDAFEFDPNIDGQAFWVDQQTIEFRPSDPLSSGQTYLAKFKLSKLMEVPDEFDELEFAFSVITQSLFVEIEGLKAKDVDHLEKQQLFGSIRTSDFTNTSNLEKCLSATQNGKDLSIIWTHEDGSKTHSFIVDGIARTNKESFVELEWNGEPIGADVEDDKEVRVPPLGEFTLQKVNTLRSPNLHFSILFSDPVDEKQDLTGLVYLNNGGRLRLVASGNEIKAFPLEKLSSEEVMMIDKSIKNRGGNQLQSSYERKVQFNLSLPAIELIGNGVIMPSGGNTNFPFKAVNLKGVNLRIVRIFEKNVPQFLQANQLDGSNELSRVGRLVYDGTIELVSSEAIDYGVWNNFSIDLSNYVDDKPGAIYRVLMSFERYQSLYPCGDDGAEIKPLKRNQPSIDDGQYYYNDWQWYEGSYNWQEKDDPCKDSYYKYYDRHISANIIASNLGMISKESADNTYDVVITDLKTTDPLKGVEVDALNYQHQIIGSGKTNGDGITRIKTDGKPYLLVAKQGKQRGYLRVDNGSALSVSLYEVGGTEVTKGIKGFIYGERGVWRPGDTLHLSFMLEDKQKALPATHPVVLELYDPQGKLYDKRVSTKGTSGLYYFKLNTAQGDPTGIWQARVMVGNSTFYKSLKIETIKPNRIRVDYDMPEVFSSGEKLSPILKGNWLYGSPAANLKARMELSVENMKTEFPKFEGYQFDDRTKRFWDKDLEQQDQTTNSEGRATFNFKFDAPSDAPGMLKVRIRTKVFEQGGDFSQDFISRKYSSYSSYVGIKLDRGKNWITAVNTEESNAVSLAAVDASGKPLSKEVTVELYKLSWNWWWEGDGNDDVTQYINASSQSFVWSKKFNISNGKSVFDLKFDKPTWGRFLLKVTNPKSGHSSSQILYAEYPGWYDTDGSGAEAAAMLSLESKREEYNVGEEIDLTVPSGGVGRIYVTVEKGDRIIEQFWVDADKDNTRFGIKATKEMAPNIYVSATLIQPHGQEENSLPIRMYGLIPIMVNDPETHVNPVISAPKEILPESTFEVSVKEEKGKAMAYSLAVVDEGLLSLTRFKTPDPWSTFYSKEALGIRTWDLYKYVMNAKTGKMTPLLAIGGDEALQYKEDEKANRFKPVVSYLGPFYLKKGETQKHQVKMPNYVGAVRVMVVAGHEGAYGSAEKEIQVKQPLMVISTLPRVLGPSEKVRVPINVITMNDKIKDVKVKVTVNDMLTTIGSAEKSLRFTKSGDKTCYFEFEVARKLGVAKFRVDVSSGSDKAFEELELLVRAPNPAITEVQNKSLVADESYKIDYTATGIKGSNSASITISRIPDLGLEKHLEYLIRYPHGCIEQTTSSVFPQLFLENLMQLSSEQKEEIRDNIVAGLNHYRQFQQSNGGFSYWPGSQGSVSDWGTNYAGHFMVEAKNKGYDLPPGLFDQWVKYQRAQASSWNRNTHSGWRNSSNELLQAYRLYTLALAGQEDIGAMNRLKNEPKLSNVAAWRLSAAYAIIGRTDAAKELASASTTIPPYREMGYSYGSHLRDKAMIIETMAYLKDYDRATPLVLELSDELKNGWHSTQTRAYGLLAVAKLSGNHNTAAPLKFTLTLNGKSESINTDLPIYQKAFDDKDLSKGSVSVKNESGQMLFLNLVQTGIPVEISQDKVRKDLGMDIKYLDMNGNPIDVTALKQGTDFKAIVSISHPGLRRNYQEVALNQIFPSGWQIVNTRVGEEGSSSGNFEYQDIRDDRVYTYFDLVANKTVNFEVLLNATFCGDFYMPGIFCAPMYDESIQALDPGKWISVYPEEGNNE
ncbi:alpha-2-macroglobulin family protein [Owenweeksia hongkongensis]|uniref:alpha-2-macroglobulin family protein n=1 Tax=Owenweeksia hongkongensis TaxID=253245 RepID=UPI003A8DBE33